MRYLWLFCILLYANSALGQSLHEEVAARWQKEGLAAAQAYNNSVLQKAKRKKDWQQQIAAEVNQVSFLFYQGKIEQTRKKLLALLNRASQKLAINNLSIGHIYNYLGGCYLAQGQWGKARWHYERALQIFESNRAWKTLLNTHASLALGALQQQEMAYAEMQLSLAGQLAEVRLSTGDATQIYIYQLLAQLYRQQGRTEEAYTYARRQVKALRSQEQLDTFALANAQNNLSVIYADLGDLEEALTVAREARFYYQQLNRKVETVLVDYQLGQLYFRDWRLEEAYSAFWSAQQQLRRLPESRLTLELQADVWEALATYYRAHHRPDSAAHYARRFFSIADSMAYRRYDIFTHRGYIAKVQCDSSAWLRAWRRARVLSDSLLGPSHPNSLRCLEEQAEVEVAMGQYEKGLELVQTALKRLSKNFRPKNWKDNPSLQQLAEPVLTLKLLITKTKALEALGRREVALTTAERGLELLRQSVLRYVQGRKKQRLLSYSGALFELAVDLQPKLEQRLAIMESSKALLLRDIFLSETAQTEVGLPDSLRKREAYLQRRAAFYQRKSQEMESNSRQAQVYNEKLEKVQESLRALRGFLEVEHADYYQRRYELAELDVAKWRSRLQPGELFVEYFMGEEQLFVLAIGPQRQIWQAIDLKKTPVLESLEKLQSSLRNPQLWRNRSKWARAVFAKEARRLFQWLLEPVLTPTDSRLYIVADGALLYLPFELLLHREPQEGQDWEALPYLMQRYFVSYQLSAGLWAQQQAQLPRNNGRLLALAPRYVGGKAVNRRPQIRQLRASLQDLPGAREEVRSLSSRYEGLYLLDSNATEEAFRDLHLRYGVLHLAMHGLLNRKEALSSALIFSENGKGLDDNLFFMHEVQYWKAKANLLVLSACETGTGAFQRGEGLLSMGRSFVYAGIPSLVTTLWSINDEASAELMLYFYEALAEGMAKDRALTVAKRRFLEENEGLAAHPYYWAPFVQWGNTLPIPIDTKESFQPWNWVLAFGIGMGILLLWLHRMRLLSHLLLWRRAYKNRR